MGQRAVERPSGSILEREVKHRTAEETTTLCNLVLQQLVQQRQDEVGTQVLQNAAYR
jgi:hypothetical protein